MPDIKQADRKDAIKEEPEIKDLPDRGKDLDTKEAQNVKGGAGTSFRDTQACPS